MIDLKKHVEKNRNGSILETPEGWVQFWRFEDSIYIDDLEVYEPGKQSVIRMTEKIENLAKEEGRRFLYTNLHPVVPGTDRMRHIVEKYGFKPVYESAVIVILKKEIV